MRNIFINVPKLTDMAEDEILSEKMLKKSAEKLGLSNLQFPKSMTDDQIDQDYRAGKFRNESVNKSHAVNIGTDNIQKKIIPLKNRTTNEEMLNSLPDELRMKKSQSKEGLIVVASLVSRHPNLGGLARTCEIFSVQQYVMNSLRDTEDKQFMALSMSAEKWLNLGELKAFQIIEYVQQMKSKGYAIIGLEQTTDSRPIHQIEFPVKSVLILG
jgi:tRNA G18 (ribose-2'-O)-methylase SpoU